MDAHDEPHDHDAHMARLLEPISDEDVPPELLALAAEVTASQQRYAAWYATLTGEQREAEDRRALDAAVAWIMHGPGGP